MISVVCPTFNSAGNIRKCLDSILIQTVLPDEVIVSDDGSYDDTLQILEKYKNSFLKKGIRYQIIQNEHRGPGFARNIGIMNSRKDWVSFIDSDDIWQKEKLEFVTNEIRINNKINTLLHLEKFMKLDGSVINLDYTKYYNNKAPLTEQLYKTNFFSTSAVTVKKKLIQKHNCFDVNLPNAQDYDLWLKVAPEMKLKIIPEFLGKYVEVRSSITRRLYYKKIKSLLIIWYRYKGYSSKKIVILKLLKIIFNKSWIRSIYN